jgi:N-acetylglucosamine malate deacetylase 2
MFDKRIIVVAAHPDDETIGLGGQLASMKDVFLIHVTDGAPRSRPDWRPHAAARRAELLAAAAIAGIPEERCLEVGLPDQESARNLIELSCHLSRTFAEIRPEIIFTHPYEGGHPDHDACAFAVQHAESSAELWEFASYHRSPLSADIETGCFLSDYARPGGHGSEAAPARAGVHTRRLRLSPEQHEQKRRMLECFVTQRETLQWFRVEQECVRRAPAYDFTEPPHTGRLFYDSYGWGVNAAEWQRLARRAERTMPPCLSR